MKKFQVIIPVVLVLIIGVSLPLQACDLQSTPNTTPSQTITTAVTSPVTTSTPITTTNTTSPTVVPTKLPNSVTLQLSKLPKVGDIANLTVSIKSNFYTTTPNRVTKSSLKFMWRNTEGTYHEYRNPMEIPLSEIIQGNTPNFTGSVSSSNPLIFTMPIKLMKPGLWDITANADIEGNGIIPYTIHLATKADKAGILGSEADRLGQLEWMKDYCSRGGSGNGKPGYPIDTYIDFPNPPQLGKPIQLSWSVSAGYDIANTKININFSREEPGSAKSVTPVESKILINGALKWQGSIKRGTPVSGIATVVLPDAGDWEINIWCTDIETGNAGVSGVWLNVSSTNSRWGWVESHAGQMPTSIPPITLQVPGK